MQAERSSKCTSPVNIGIESDNGGLLHPSKEEGWKGYDLKDVRILEECYSKHGTLLDLLG